MTLIVGTPHWNGVCLNSDTRVTNPKTGVYTDDAQKFAHIHGGIGMVASGDRQSAIIVRETLRDTLEEYKRSGKRFDHSVDLSGVMRDLLVTGLKNTRNHKLHQSRSIYETYSKGLIGVTISDQHLRLNREESNNLLSIILNGSHGYLIEESFYKKYMMQIVACSSGSIPCVEFDEYPHNVLYKYELKLFDDESDDICKVDKVTFGEIAAFGSGSEFDYSGKRDRVLFFVLFNGRFKDVGLGSLHLSMIHEYAEQMAPTNKMFNIKTFGGAIIPGIITTPDADTNSLTAIITGELGSKIENRVISTVYEKAKQLRVVTRSGEHLKLVPFPDKLDSGDGMYW